ncbi:MAG: hypothetical protein K5756_00345 [Clostridiales bacterium]|nr:hypothetical protein [Clostridiales bacterium]
MTENRSKNITDALCGGLINAMYIFPLAIAFGLYSGFGAVAGLVSALAATALIPAISGKGEYPYLCSCPIFLIASDIFMRYGKTTALVAFLFSGVFLLIFSLFGKKPYELAGKMPVSVSAGLSIGFFIIMFIKQVTNYFEIGAVGNTPFELFKNYASVGFHANWRTVLYSTIMLVVLITYPFKYKKASKIVSPAFLGIVITTALNFLLNPSGRESDIPELGALDFSRSGIVGVTLPFNWFGAVLGGLSLAVIVIIGRAALAQDSLPGRSETIALGAVNLILPFFGALPVTASRKGRYGKAFFTGIVTCLFIIMFLTAFKIPVQRIPVSPLATVLVITAWLDINWKTVAAGFKGGILTAALLIAAALCTFFFNLIIVIPVAAAVGFTAAMFKKNRKDENLS